MRVFQLLVLLLLWPLLVCGQADGDAIVGLWETPEKDGQIEIIRAADSSYEGYVRWYLVDGKDKKEVKDIHNPDPSKRNHSPLNMRLLSDFRYEEGHWQHGHVYDPYSGSTYKARIKYKPGNPDRIELRGYIGIPLLGRTVTWHRISFSELRPSEPNAQ